MDRYEVWFILGLLFVGVVGIYSEMDHTTPAIKCVDVSQ